MNGEEVLKLIDAGFTADEIRKMGAKTEESETGSGEEPVQGTGTEQSPEGAVHAGEIEDAKSIIESLTGEVSKLTETVRAIQEANIKNARTGSASAGDPVADQIQKFVSEL